MKRHLIVAQEPGTPTAAVARVLHSQSGGRLAMLAGTTLDEIMANCHAVNIRPTGHETIVQMRDFGRSIYELFMRGDSYESLLVIGAFARRAMRRTSDLPAVFAGDRLFILPHTSGRNRWWNDPRHYEIGEKTAHMWWHVVEESRRCA